MRHAGIAEAARDALRRHVLEPLVPHCIDREYGGFLVDFDERWRPAGPHEKTLEHASRTTAAFAMVERAMPGEGCAELVRHGCDFLQEAFWDARHGGFFAKVDRAGHPCWDGLKHPHAVTYAARAFLLAEPYLPAGEGRLWALRTLAWLEDVAWDPVHGGYWGSFRRENERYDDGAQLPTYDGRDLVGTRPGFKEVNTLGDAIEMLTEFVRQGLRVPPAGRLEFLASLVAERLRDPGGALPYLYRRDWRPVADLVRVGQQFQMAHRLLAAAALTGAGCLIAAAGALADFCLEFARHPEGGFCLAVTGDGRTWPATGPTTDLRYWWVQLEAVQALHALSKEDGIHPADQSRYGSARDEQWAYLRRAFFDTRFGGIHELPEESNWRLRLPAWLARKPAARKTHGWKDPFHEVGTFLALAQPEDSVKPFQAFAAPQR